MNDSTDVAEALEIERERIAAEIHDGLLPYLFAAAAKCSALRRSDPPLDPRSDESIGAVADWIDQSRQAARDLMNAVSLPDDVRDQPLIAARDFLRSVLVPSGQAVFAGENNVVSDHLERDATANRPVLIHWPSHCTQLSDKRIDGRTAAAVYRIVCESVRNAVRHAGARQVTVDLQVHADVVNGFEIRISDDGHGFDPAVLNEQSNRGLGWMAMRAKLAGLTFEVESKPNAGTVVRLARQ